VSADAIELATAYVQVVPSLAGSQGKLAEELIGEASTAGDKAGQATGGKFQQAMAKVPWGKIAAGAGAAVVGGFVGLYKIGETFDEVTDTIRVGTGATGAALDGLVDVAKSVGKNVPAEFSAIGPVVADLNTRLGLSGDTLETVASQYLEAGRILGKEVDVQKTTAAFSAFGIEGAAVEGAMDALFRTSQATGVGMNELAATVKNAAPAAKALGFGFADTAAMIGVMDKAGLDANRMTAALSKGIVTLAKDGEAPSEAFRRVVGEIEGFIATGDEAAALNLASKVFGTRGATQFVDALKSGKLNLNDLQGAMGATGDTILAAGEDTADFAEKWQLVQNNAQLALEPLATTVFTALGDALSAAMPYLQDFGSWLAENQWVLGVVAGVIGTTLVGAFFAWAASIWAANAALLANPITWIVLAVIALIAAIVALAMNWDSVVAWVSDVWGGFVDWLGQTWDAIVAAVTGFGEQVSSFLAGLWDSIVNTAVGLWDGLVAFFAEWGPRILIALGGPIVWLVAWLASNWEQISATARGIWDKIVGFVTGIPNRLLSGLAALGQLGGKAAAWFLGVLTAAKDKLGQTVDWVKGIPNRIVSALGNLANLLVNSGKNLINGFLKGIKNAWSGLTSWVKDGMANLRGLWPFSPAKWGPFAGHGYVTYSGEAMTADFAASIAQGTDAVHRAALGMMDAAAVPAPALTADVPGGTAAAGITVQGPLVHVDRMEVRSDSDIRKVSQALQEGIEGKLRALGGGLNLAGGVA